MNSGERALRRFLNSLRAALRRRRDDSGAVIEEFSILMPIICAMILGTLEVGYIYLAKTELNRIAMQAARIVETGNAASLSQSQFGTAACGNLAVILQCNGLMISLTPQTSCASVTNTLPTLTYNSNGSVANVFNYSPGTGGQIMVIQLLYQLPVFGAGLLNFSSQSNGTLLISSTYVFANEP